MINIHPSNRTPRLVITAAVALLLSTGSVLAATNIGKTTTVQGQVHGALDGNTRKLKRTDAVFFNEVVTTGKASTSIVTFVDETFLQIGPEADVILDSLIYDPAHPEEQEMVLNLVKGTFRFVSGRLEKSAYRVVTPVGQVGIRGTSLVIDIKEDGTTRIFVEQGAAHLSSEGSKPIDIKENQGWLIPIQGKGQPQLIGKDNDELVEAIAVIDTIGWISGGGSPGATGDDNLGSANNIRKSQDVYTEGCK